MSRHRPSVAIRLAFLFALALTLGTAPAGAEGPIDAGWALDSIWDDGLAEVARYDAARRIYGASRPYEAVLITVKEDFDGRQLVKADSPYGSRPIRTVLKQNAVREIETPNYPYRIMTSTFVDRGNPARLVKLTSGSHEWCGNTWKAVRNRDGRLTYTWESYFDGEGDGRQELTPQAGDLLEDQLPLALRGLRFERGITLRFRLLPSLATTHGGPLRWRDAELRVAAREPVDVPAGRLDAWRVELRAGGDEWTLWFDAAGTRPLVRMEASDGRSLRLNAIERRAYWKLP